jgi:hypothetical protein
MHEPTVNVAAERLHLVFPQRSIDWRWQAARELAAEPESERPSWFDDWIGSGMEYAAIIFHGRGDRERLQTVARLRAIREAHRINGLEEPLRWHLEARILTGASAEVIALKCAIPVAVVAAYERLFYDARRRLHARSFIVQQVIGPAVHEGFTFDEPEIYWKLFGYFYGPHMLDALVELADAHGKLGHPDDGAIRSPEQTRLLRSTRMAILTQGTPHNAKTDRLFLRLFLHNQEIEERESARRINAAPPVIDVPYGDIEQAQTSASAATRIPATAQGADEPKQSPAHGAVPFAAHTERPDLGDTDPIPGPMKERRAAGG